jgi:hypothetical protein
VDLVACTCTCGRYQVNNIPCGGTCSCLYNSQVAGGTTQLYSRNFQPTEVPTNLQPEHFTRRYYRVGSISTLSSPHSIYTPQFAYLSPKETSVLQMEVAEHQGGANPAKARIAAGQTNRHNRKRRAENWRKLYPAMIESYLQHSDIQMADSANQTSSPTSNRGAGVRRLLAPSSWRS